MTACEDRMKILLGICAAMALALSAATAMAADVTGSWTATMQGPDGGGGMQLTFTFKQDGGAVTGTVVTPQGGDPIAISNGKIDGDKLTFDVSFNGMTIHHAGTVTADEIKLSSKSDSGDFPAMELTLKKAAAAPAQ